MMDKSTTWTTEPWYATTRSPGSEYVSLMCEQTGCPVDERREPNALRIVACVNALSGIDDPAAFVREAKEAKALNKELREELKLLTEKYHRAAGEAMYHRDIATDKRRRDLEQQREAEI